LVVDNVDVPVVADVVGVVVVGVAVLVVFHENGIFVFSVACVEDSA
jgi:hypothetical protein